MTDIDTVAKAIANAQGVFDYWGSPHCPQDNYRKMAQAAIGALQLTQEKSVRRESFGYYAYPTRYRLVSPWVEEQP